MMTFFQAFSFALMVSFALYFFRDELTQLFTDGRDGVDVTIALAVIPLFSLTNMVDMCLSFFMGCVRALGIQANVALISISCFYLISLPTASYLAFVADAGIRGLWIGYFLGIVIQVIIVAWLTWSEDWQDIADEAEDRLKHDYKETLTLLPDRFTDLDYYSLFGGPDSEDEERQALIEEVQWERGSNRRLTLGPRRHSSGRKKRARKPRKPLLTNKSAQGRSPLSLALAFSSEAKEKL